ncbi:hypothetical protein LPLAFNJD_LOCUS2557 [Methylorubrum aminovorans]
MFFERDVSLCALVSTRFGCGRIGESGGPNSRNDGPLTRHPRLFFPRFLLPLDPAKFYGCTDDAISAGFVYVSFEIDVVACRMIG